MKRQRGQITLFLSLTAVLIFSLICTALEGARAACLEYLTGTAAASALESVFAGYDTDLLENSGLLALRGREGDRALWSEKAESYLGKYLKPAEGTFLTGDRVQLRELSLSESCSLYLTDDRGRVFAEAVLEYMESAGLSSLIQETCRRFSRLGQDAEKLSETAGALLSEDFSLDSIVGSYEDLKDSAEALLEQLAEESPEGEPGAEAETAPEDDPEELPEEEESTGQGRRLKDVLERLRSLYRQGGFSLVLGIEKVSTLSYRLPDLPSALSEAEKDRHSGFTGLNYSPEEKMLLTEYALERMSCCTKRQKEGRQYEVEYLLSGAASDDRALETALTKILLLRTCFNAAYLLSDETKMEEIRAAGLALMTLLRAPQLKELGTALVLALWAMAEGMADIRALVKGKTVPIWKNAANWQLSTLSLEGESADSRGLGLGYRDYLRLMLWLEPGEKLSYRMMDVLQIRMQLLNEQFRIREYMVYAALDLAVSAGNLYLQFPLFRRLTGAGGGRRFTTTVAFGY